MTKQSKAEKLVVAGYAAPRLRGDNSRRRVTVVDSDGNPVRTITRAEMAAGLLERAGIELSLEKPTKEDLRSCEECLAMYRKTSESTLRRCKRCSLTHRRRQLRDSKKRKKQRDPETVAKARRDQKRRARERDIQKVRADELKRSRAKRDKKMKQDPEAARAAVAAQMRRWRAKKRATARA